LNTYEGMFVVDTKEVRKETQDAEEKLQGLITKSGGEVAVVKRWDERKLAYEIKGRIQGLYMLIYFTGDADVVKKLTRECQLSPLVLRLLCLKVTEVPDLEALEKASASLFDDDSRDDGRYRRDYGRRPGGPPPRDRETRPAEPAVPKAEPAVPKAEPAVPKVEESGSVVAGETEADEAKTAAEGEATPVESSQPEPESAQPEQPQTEDAGKDAEPAGDDKSS